MPQIDGTQTDDLATKDYAIEQNIGEWRSFAVDADGFAETVNFCSDSYLSAVDNIFYARVTEVNPSLNMAFFDLGNHQKGCMSFRRAKQLVKGSVQSISDCLQQGQYMMVQGLADPSALEQKSIQLTAKPRLVGRFVVIEQAAPRLFFSKDLPPRTVKTLGPILEDLAQDFSLIVRTHARDQDSAAVRAEAEWLASAFKLPNNKKPQRLFSYTPLEQALMQAPSNGTIWLDSGYAYAEAKNLCDTRWSDLSSRLALWQDDQALADAFGLDDALDDALGDKIDLPCGGWITIEETTALTVIDVNVGSALRGRTAAEALLTVNMEAAMALLYHLKLQDIGGLVIVDFVDMSAKGSAAQLIQVIDQAIKDDDVPIRRSGLSQFGLMELSRRRKGLSLKQRMQTKRRALPSVRAQAMDIIKKAHKLGLTKDAGSLLIHAPAAVQRFLEQTPMLIEDLKQATHRSVSLKLHDRLHVILQ